MSEYIVFTSNEDLGDSPSFGEIPYTKTGSSGSVYTYTADTIVYTIADNTFSSRYTITSATIPFKVTAIGNYAFAGCTSLTSITIPSSVTSIGNYAFQYCVSLTSITIPSNVTSIGDGAWKGCGSLTSITIPNTVTIINYETFHYCGSLTSIDIPSSVTVIGPFAFRGCTNLTSVIIPSSVTIIYGNAFTECIKLTSINMPISITFIGDYIFESCTSLTSITIPQRIDSIGLGAFRYCINIETITLPGSILSIGPTAFQGCSSLTSLSIPSQVSIIPDSLCEDCSHLINVIIPSNVQSIGNNAFRGCSSMTVLLLPSILTSIGDNAFSGCTAFKTISVYSNITTIGQNIFGSVSNNTNCPNLIMKLIIPNTAVSLSTIPIYTYTTTNYPNMLINIKYINDTNTTYTISVVKNTTQTTESDTTSVVTCNAITQLRRSNIPTTVPIRFNPVSPYSQYTQDQLAMRRKAEILQYNANKQNTKQNGTTKKQAFSYLANNPQISASTNSITTRKVCDQNLISVPTSSSNVPGPIEYLYMDPSVPLYNYNDNRNYNLYIQTDTRKWNIFTYTDVELSETNDKTVMSIYVRNGIENNYTTFSLIEPVLITVSGSNNTITDYDLDFFRNTVSITVTQVIFQIHYNTTPIQTITVSNPTNATTTNKLSVMYLDTSISGSNPFSASIFIGNLELNDVVLYTPPNIIYDINILATVELDTGSQDYDVDAYFSNITYTAIYNTTSRVDTTNNCLAYSNTTNQYVSSIVGQ